MMSEKSGSSGKTEIWAAGIGRPSRATYGSDLVVEMLRALDIRYIALNPGSSYRGLHDSLVNFEPGGGPEVILCTHEEIAVALANGYARATGKVMATGLHNIVGLQHASMAIFNAWCDRTPIFNLGGGGPQNAMNRRSTDWVHTALVQGNLVRDFVKYDDQPQTIEAVPESLLRAHRIATTEPKGPVYICLDSDVQEEKISTPLFVPDAKLFRPPAPAAPNPAMLERAAELLAGARWPVIVAGELGRNPQSLPVLRELAELIAAPVIDFDGRFAFPTRHALNLTTERGEALSRADVVLALDVPSLGVPLGPAVRERGNFQPAIRPDARIIHITLLDLERQGWVSDAMWLLPVEAPIAADTSVALPQLVGLLKDRLARGGASAGRISERRTQVEVLHAEGRERTEAWIKKTWNDKPVSQARLYGEIDRRMQGKSWALVSAHGRRWREVFDASEAPHGIGGGRGGGVGYELPAAIGAALGFKGTGRLCVGVVGDGDFLMTSNALWTAARYEIPLLVVILNNHSYYNDEEHQERMAIQRGRPVENKVVGIRIDNPIPDPVTIARGLGVEGFGPVADPTELGPTLDRALDVVRRGKPVLVDVISQPR
jgi:thiamine pyrophosphate-dependent acetolactate synthase large subunit-like protein